MFCITLYSCVYQLFVVFTVKVEVDEESLSREEQKE